MNNEINKSLTFGIGAVMAASLGVSVGASLEDEADTVFVLNSLDDHDILSSDEEGECGEGKCGDDDGEDAEGECGEGKCGEDGDDTEGECGEGKCGEDSDGDDEDDSEDEGEETTEE
ncbi:MAG: hypothetical protein F4039_10880 [Gammaproteobacteria bacterium]|nr:hypothetical protein [Gammaproteobacteria bacterium]MXX94646.1 hypothetical protein [Gammaproteobacteria bacterium]MYF53776.1 hypothetical protein [Gammaproteobacteria bacterium]MYK44569.1 hypothetical protein [Gammaproteobacteria bacterium]